jgi:hypothetical protein
MTPGYIKELSILFDFSSIFCPFIQSSSLPVGISAEYPSDPVRYGNIQSCIDIACSYLARMGPAG